MYVCICFFIVNVIYVHMKHNVSLLTEWPYVDNHANILDEAFSSLHEIETYIWVWIQNKKRNDEIVFIFSPFFSNFTMFCPFAYYFMLNYIFHWLHTLSVTKWKNKIEKKIALILLFVFFFSKKKAFGAIETAEYKVKKLTKLMNEECRNGKLCGKQQSQKLLTSSK